jgi:type II secretory pathway predicted ATPase ExeA
MFLFAFDERIKSLGWRDFPFRMDVMPQVFAGQKRIMAPLLMQLRTGSIVLIEGGRGTGKTHILRWLQQHLSKSTDMIPCLVSEPLDTRILSDALTTMIEKYTLEPVGSPPTLIDSLTDMVREFSGRSQKRVVLLLDEGDALAPRPKEADPVRAEKQKTVRWLHVLSDLSAVVVFIAGVTGFGQALSRLFAPFADRVTLHMTLEQPSPNGPEVLTRQETEELVRQRIESFGGHDIAPFTPEAIDTIHAHTRGYPRATLRFLENTLTVAFQEDTPAGDRITRDFIRQVIALRSTPPPEVAQPPLQLTRMPLAEEESEEPVDGWVDDSNEITAIQRDILSLVRQKHRATSALVAEELGIAKGTASNELKKLYDMRKVHRRKSYRGYEYLPVSADSRLR